MLRFGGDFSDFLIDLRLSSFFSGEGGRFGESSSSLRMSIELFGPIVTDLTSRLMKAARRRAFSMFLFVGEPSSL